jgi:hypothetical protein
MHALDALLAVCGRASSSPTAIWVVRRNDLSITCAPTPCAAIARVRRYTAASGWKSWARDRPPLAFRERQPGSFHDSTASCCAILGAVRACATFGEALSSEAERRACA